MKKTFDVSKFKLASAVGTRFDGQLLRLSKTGRSTEQIKQAVAGAMGNISSGTKSFVIYGEPQSGKTEMMICLTAKLLDEGHRFILHLLNDSVDLLGQNLMRFKASGLTPSARNFSEILDPAVTINDQPHVIFCKKNANDLRNLLDKIGEIQDIVVIDDEADFASPNSKVNSGGITRINALITEIKGNTGLYIGVTATPARLDLNNTFDNDSERWVVFPPHPTYTGQEVFFPLAGPVRYRRMLLSDSGADPKHARDALFRFLVTVSYLNLHVHPKEIRNYSFLVHTSGIKADHKSDWATIYSALNALVNRTSDKFEKYVEQVWTIATDLYQAADPDAITQYVVDNVGRNSIVILNSERDWKNNSAAATSPTSLFTIIIGGNIVSRGVTLENLLSMFFTRDVKHKIQQDTYIQRARMFGNRNAYLEHFELTIPAHLYVDWHRCFVFHSLSLSAIRDHHGSPVWLSDSRISAVATSSIDRSTVDLNRGEMSFPLFQLDRSVVDRLLTSKASNLEKLRALAKALGKEAFPEFLLRFIEATLLGNDSLIALHSSADVSKYRADEGTDPTNITRRRGFFGTTQKDAPNSASAVHHVKIFRNDRTGFARLFYKFEGSIQFIKNEK